MSYIESSVRKSSTTIWSRILFWTSASFGFYLISEFDYFLDFFFLASPRI